MKIRTWIIENSSLYFRFVLFLAFTGHGLVSLGFSPSYGLHFNILSAVNFTGIPTEKILIYQGIFDLLLAVCVLTGFYLRALLPLILIYLVSVGIAAIFFFHRQTDSVFGIAEFMRRMAWMFFTIYLLFDITKGIKRQYLIRHGISFAFLAHGLASLGFFGLKGGHVELATKIISEEQAQQFVFYSGISDSIIGLSLLSGFFSRYVAPVSAIWIFFIVVLSYITSFPDGIFRTGFLLGAIFITLERKCHDRIFKSGKQETLKQ